MRATASGERGHGTASPAHSALRFPLHLLHLRTLIDGSTDGGIPTVHALGSAAPAPGCTAVRGEIECQNWMKRTLGAALLAAGLASARSPHAAPPVKVGSSPAHGDAVPPAHRRGRARSADQSRREGAFRAGEARGGACWRSAASTAIRSLPPGSNNISRSRDRLPRRRLAVGQRDGVVPCKPADPTRADDSCARKFVAAQGVSGLFRRPLTEAWETARVRTAAAGTAQLHDFHGGLELALTSLLIAPEFFSGSKPPNPIRPPGQYRLDAYTKAARLSFLSGTPRRTRAARGRRSGAIHTDAGSSSSSRG